MPFPPVVDPVAALSAAERERTARSAALADLGELGQRRIANAHVAIVGAGGLGSAVILALAAAGVGRITVVDDDVVDASNLQRQVLHRVGDVGAPKTASAVRAAAGLSPETVVHERRERLDAGNAARLLGGADVVVDGSDSFATRAAVAAACEASGVPLVWGVVQEFAAQVTVFWSAPPGAAADAAVPVRLRDLHPPESAGEPPACAAIGVLGALCLQVGGMLAAETIKLLAGIGEPLLGRVAVIDALTGTQTEVALRPARATESAPSAAPGIGFTPAAPVVSAPPARRDAPRELTATQMLAAQEAGATLLDVREPIETATGVVAGSVVIPLAALLTDPDAAGPGPVVVICAHGIRARQAAELLAGRGVDAAILAGGLAAWTSA